MGGGEVCPRAPPGWEGGGGGRCALAAAAWVASRCLCTVPWTRVTAATACCNGCQTHHNLHCLHVLISDETSTGDDPCTHTMQLAMSTARRACHASMQGGGCGGGPERPLWRGGMSRGACPARCWPERQQTGQARRGGWGCAGLLTQVVAKATPAAEKAACSCTVASCRAASASRSCSAWCHQAHSQALPLPPASSRLCRTLAQ